MSRVLISGGFGLLGLHRQRDGLRRRLASKGIGCGIHYPIRIRLIEGYQKFRALAAGSLQSFEPINREILSLPMYPESFPAQIEPEAEALGEFSLCMPPMQLVGAR